MDVTPQTHAALQAHLVLGGLQDFPMIYEDVIRQFPKTELYEYEDFVTMLDRGRYKILLYRRAQDEELIGYSLVYLPESGDVFWMDYLAIMAKFQSHGYGQKLFEAVRQKYCGPFDGMIFSVEHVDSDDPQQAQRQKRRIGFYEKLGAHRLQLEFLQPWESGSFPMYLYYKPKKTPSVLSCSAQEEAVAQMYEYCCTQFPASHGLISQFRDTIRDEYFTD